MLRRLYEILDLAPDHLAVLHREIADVRPPLRRAHLVHRVEFDADIQQAWHPVTDERLAIANRGHAVAGERLLTLRHLDQAVCRRAVKQRADRKGGGEGKGVAVRVDLWGEGIIK